MGRRWIFLIEILGILSFLGGDNRAKGSMCVIRKMFPSMSMRVDQLRPHRTRMPLHQLRWFSISQTSFIGLSKGMHSLTLSLNVLPKETDSLYGANGSTRTVSLFTDEFCLLLCPNFLYQKHPHHQPKPFFFLEKYFLRVSIVFHLNLKHSIFYLNLKFLKNISFKPQSFWYVSFNPKSL